MESKMNKYNYKKLEYEEFLQYIDKICKNLEKYMRDNKIKIFTYASKTYII